MVLSFHITPCAGLNAIKCAWAAPFITMSMYLEWLDVQAFTFLCTHYAPIMHLCILSGIIGRKQDDLYFICYYLWYSSLWYKTRKEDREPHCLRPKDKRSPDSNNRKVHVEMMMTQMMMNTRPKTCWFLLFFHVYTMLLKSLLSLTLKSPQPKLTDFWE